MENNNKYLVSLVVPTKNRYPYLFKLIELLQTFDLGEEFELVIQDNNEDNTPFLQYIKQNPYSNLNYYYDPSPMPISDNCDKAINNSKGEYVCFIGDDDCITRNFMPCIKWMQRNNVECVFPRRIMYFWPDYCDYGDEKAAVHYERFTNDIALFKTSEVLNKLLSVGCVWPDEIPMIYHGIVKRTVLHKIWAQCETYFPGASPDIASGICLCMVIEAYASFRFPIIVAGNSRTGGGGQKVLKHHATTDFSKLTHLPSNIEEIWDKRIPKIWSNSTIWCESVVEALRRWNRNDLVDNINFEALYCNFVINYSYYRKMAYKLSSNKISLFFKSLYGSMVLASKKIVKGLLRLLHINHDRRVRKLGINNIEELCRYFEREGYLFEDYFS